MFKANQIADFFISNVDIDAGDTISHLKLQKLVYYAQAWHYVIFGRPLFTEKIEAWMHGPVIRSIYDRFKSNQVYVPIDVVSIHVEKIDFPLDTLNLLNDVNSIYGEHSASYLEDLTHSEKPWIMARGGIAAHEKCTNEITLESMKEYYSSLNGAK